MSQIVIRRAEAADGDAVGIVTEAVYRDGYISSEEYLAELRDGARRIRDAIVFVAELDGRIVGSVTVAPPGTPYAEISGPHELEVRMLGVAPDVRRAGAADGLMDAAEAEGRALGLTGVVLSTAPSMTGAHRLYERRGYVRAPDRDWHVDGLDLMAYDRTL